MKRLNKRTKHRMLFLVIPQLIFLIVAIFFVLLDAMDTKQTVSSSEIYTKKALEKKTELLDVPFESQYEPVPLENGCEVTALSMLLNFYGYHTNKNELAQLTEVVPVLLGNGLRGNPDDGFVGYMSGGELAMGASVEPMADVAEKIVSNDYQVEVSRTKSIDELSQLLDKGIPIWVKVTVDFVNPSGQFMYWETTSGQIKVTALNHACVVTGIDENYVYVNDPQGEKNEKVAIDDFEKSYTEMGSQALWLTE